MGRRRRNRQPETFEQFITRIMGGRLEPWQLEMVRRIDRIATDRARRRKAFEELSQRLKKKPGINWPTFVIDEAGDIPAFMGVDWAKPGAERTATSTHARRPYAKPTITDLGTSSEPMLVHRLHARVNVLEQKVKMHDDQVYPYGKPAVADRLAALEHDAQRAADILSVVDVRVTRNAEETERRFEALHKCVARLESLVTPLDNTTCDQPSGTTSVDADKQWYCPTCRFLIATEQIGFVRFEGYSEGDQLKPYHYPHGTNIAGRPLSELHRVTCDPAEFHWNQPGPHNDGAVSATSQADGHADRVELRSFHIALSPNNDHQRKLIDEWWARQEPYVNSVLGIRTERTK